MVAYEDFKEFYSIRECPYCKIYDVKEIRQQDAFSVVECTHCGLYFFSPRMNKEGQKKYLADYNRRIESDDFQVNINELSPVERNFLFKGIGNKKLKILDVGSYTGSFVSGLNSMGHDAAGVEPLQKPAEFARSKSLKAVNCVFDENIYEHFGGGQFDLITFRESIYYLPDLKETFKIIKTLLKRRGCVYIKCHGVDSPYYWFNNYHRRYGLHVSGMPTRKSMRKILENEGFQILDVRKWPQNNLSFHINNKILANMRNKRIIGFLLSYLGHISGRLLNLLGREDRFLVLARYDKI